MMSMTRSKKLGLASQYNYRMHVSNKSCTKNIPKPIFRDFKTYDRNYRGATLCEGTCKELALKIQNDCLTKQRNVTWHVLLDLA